MKRLAAVLGLLATIAAGAACDHGGDSSPGAGGAVCGTCSYVYSNGGIACGDTPAGDTYVALMLCACGDGPCAIPCGQSMCQQLPADDTCGGCLLKSCASQETACAAN
jgi:hypothetical protein